MNASPQIRALVKVVFLLLAMMIGVIVAALTALYFGPGSLLIAAGLILMAYIVKNFYDSQVAEEQYKDELQRLHNTIRGE
jgi:uncharacterized membrane protein YoaK (UPF0700 family)